MYGPGMRTQSILAPSANYFYSMYGVFGSSFLDSLHAADRIQGDKRGQSTIEFPADSKARSGVGGAGGSFSGKTRCEVGARDLGPLFWAVCSCPVH